METSFNDSFWQDDGITRRNNNLGGMKMKRLWEDLKIGTVCMIAFVILFALCCLGGFIAVFIAKLFITSFKVIMIIGCIGYLAIVGAVIFFSLKWIKKCKQKNSQENTRK